MPAADDLKRELHARWQGRMQRIKEANSDFGERIQTESLAFEWDIDEDVFTVAIGARPAFVYTQGDENMYADVDDADRIVAITIHQFSEYLRDHPGLTGLATALRDFGRIEIPPPPPGERSSRVQQELRELVLTL
ncbi:MAG TPA: hypothetical protein VNM91_10400 [Dehalococcoidia bacterium]|nr:hypothetical protein [Dehalococcoidia bacterium]